MLSRRLPLRVGDRAVLREPGGKRPPCAVTVLDVCPPPLVRRGAGRARAAELETMTGQPDGPAELRRRGLVRRSQLVAMGVPAAVAPVSGDWLADPAHWGRLRGRLAAEVERYARQHPLEPGLPAEAARRLLELPDRALVDALAATPGSTELLFRQGRLHAAGAVRPTLPPALRAAVDAVRQELQQAPFRAPEAGRLAALGLTRKALAAAVAAGALLRVGDAVVLLPDADVRAAAVLRRLPQPFTLSEARKALDTTRRVAVPLLEFLDARGHTERVDDQRRRCRTAETDGDGRESNPFFDSTVTCDDAENRDK
jgi:selenocysteine-specific elongation factor